MRALTFFFIALTLPLAGCYNAGDLGETPFRCSINYPECPDGYICGIDTVPTSVGKLTECPSKTNCVCVPNQ